MKRSLILFAVMLMTLPFALNAQLLDFGIKGGANFPSLNSTGSSSPNWSSKTGWHGGVMAKINTPIIQIQGEALYSQTSFNSPEWGDFDNATITLPITAQFNFLSVFTLHAGPQFVFVTSQKIADLDFKEQMDNEIVTFVVGAGVTLGQLDLHARFILPSTTDVNYLGAEDELRSSNFQVSLGYWFNN